MLDYKYEVGMRVRDRYNREQLGEVTEVVDEDEVHVKWDNGDNYRHDPSEILPYDPQGDKELAAKIQAKVDEATHSLEAAFKAWQEAQDLSGGEPYDVKYNTLIDLKRFEGVFENYGWSPSSLYC